MSETGKLENNIRIKRTDYVLHAQRYPVFTYKQMRSQEKFLLDQHYKVHRSPLGNNLYALYRSVKKFPPRFGGRLQARKEFRTPFYYQILVQNAK